MKAKSIKVILDTNVWMSFLIGKRLAFIREHIVNGRIIIIVTPQLLTEILEVADREKLKKYFPRRAVIELIEFLEAVAENIEVSPIHFLCKDPKDNFLPDLIDFSKADFLVTGDKSASILTPANFANEVIM